MAEAAPSLGENKKEVVRSRGPKAEVVKDARWLGGLAQSEGSNHPGFPRAAPVKLAVGPCVKKFMQNSVHMSDPCAGLSGNTVHDPLVKGGIESQGVLGSGHTPKSQAKPVSSLSGGNSGFKGCHIRALLSLQPLSPDPVTFYGLMDI